MSAQDITKAKKLVSAHIGKCECGITWYKIGVGRAWPGLTAVSRALVSSGK